MANSEYRNDTLAAQPPQETARAHLRVLDALLNVEGDDADFARLFRAYHALFAFDGALVLQEDGTSVNCIAAEPKELIGRQWPILPLLHEVVHGRVLAISGTQPGDEREQLPADLIARDEGALLLPIAVRDRHAALLLRRSAGREDFGDLQLVLARQYSVFALAILGMRNSERIRHEGERLRRLIEDLQRDGQETSPSHDLFKEIIEQLPIGLTVQDEEGRFILVNSVAAANLAMSPDALLVRGRRRPWSPAWALF